MFLLKAKQLLNQPVGIVTIVYLTKKFFESENYYESGIVWQVY